MANDDEEFVRRFARQAANIRGVLAVALGGSRAEGTYTDDSDFDFAIYYRRTLNPDDVRAVGWEGDVFSPGAWGGGVMNGGAFLRVEGRKVDLHYRDLQDVEHWLAESKAGRFEVQRLPLYLAGIPTYVVAGELAIGRVLVGRLPRPEYPSALRESAAPFWRGAARLSLLGAEGYAERALVPETAGNLCRALLETAHARLGARGEWVLNEKRLVDRAGLGHARQLFDRFTPSRRRLRAVVADVGALLE